MGIALFLVASLLGLVLLPLGLIVGLAQAFVNVQPKTGLRKVNEKLFHLAKALDIYGNSVCAELFNATLITRASLVPFGNYGQTISSVIGFNLVAGTLSRTGRILNAVLNFFEKDHTLKAIGLK